MHDYSIDRHPKEKILFLLAFAAITLAPILNNAANKALTSLSISTHWGAAPITAIPVFGLFFGIYYLFDNTFWKLRWMRKLLLVPDLNGKWICDGETVLKHGERASFAWSGDVTITQSWSKISIHLRTASSRSKSVAASIFHEPGAGYRILYEYSNDPDADQHELEKHTGSAELVFSEGCLEASGHYFTDRHRSTVGTMKLRRV